MSILFQCQPRTAGECTEAAKHPCGKPQGTVAAGGLYSSSITPEYDCTVTRSVMVPLEDT